jgi:hypothetical protein
MPWRTLIILVGVGVSAFGIVQHQRKIMAKLSTLAGQLGVVETTLVKVQAEIVTLQGSLGDVDIPVAAQESLDRLSALATALDELNPDAVPDPPPA